MASISPPSILNASASANPSTATISTSSFLSPLSGKPCQSFNNRAKRCYVSKVACEATNSDPKNPKTNLQERLPHILGNRRSVLIGLGGLCGAATLSNNSFAVAAPDWLNSGFLFYDENKNLVRAKGEDCLETEKLGYVYQDVDIPWLKAKPTPRRSRAQKVAKRFGIGTAMAAETSRSTINFPLVLDSKVSTVVKRPKKSRSKKEKEDEEEVLVIDGIEFDRNVRVKFDVYINNEDDKLIGPTNREFAGSFVSVPHGGKKKKINTRFRFGLTDLLEDLGAEDDDSVVVTLVPRYGTDLVKIGGAKIELTAE